MNKLVEGRVRLYLFGFISGVIITSSIWGFMWVEEVKTQGYYYELNAASDNEFADIEKTAN